MNHTNRFVNRLILFVVGLLSLVAGAGAVTVQVWPAAARWWTAESTAARGWIDEAIATTMIEGSTLSWIAVGSLALIVLIIVLVVITLARLGGGRTHELMHTGGHDSTDGRIVIDTGFASDALRQSLNSQPEVLFSRVSAANIRRQPMMHLSVTPRQNTSPRQVADDVDRLLKNLAVLTGAGVPTYLSIHTGLRSRLAHDQPRIG